MKIELALDPKLEAAMSYPLGHVIQRYARDYGMAYDTAERHVNELRRYLFLCGRTPTRGYGMRGQVDKAWHTFLMFTRDYHQFCLSCMGRFIHHQPDIERDDRDLSLEAYKRFLHDYEEFFGAAAPADLWPRPVSLDSSSDGCGGCDGCGVDVAGIGAGADIANSYSGDGCNGCHGCSDG